MAVVGWHGTSIVVPRAPRNGWHEQGGDQGAQRYVAVVGDWCPMGFHLGGRRPGAVLEELAHAIGIPPGDTRGQAVAGGRVGSGGRRSRNVGGMDESAPPPPGAILYIAGPMRHHPDGDGGKAAFAAAAALLRGAGYRVLSPAEHDAECGVDIATVRPADLREVIAWDTQAVAGADGLVLLPGWERSEGSAIELRVARFVGLPVYELTDGWLRLLPSAPRLVGISGFAGAGKDSVALQLAERHGYERVAFADKVKALAVALDPTLAAQVEAGTPLDELKGEPSVRRWLQDVGLAVRKVLDEDVWVRVAIDDLDPRGRYVITDMRFSNELAAIRARGGIAVRIERPGVGPANDHPSELELADRDDWDLVVVNDGGLFDLGEAADRIAALVEERVAGG